MKKISSNVGPGDAEPRSIERHDPLRFGKYFAQISRDPRVEPAVFHFIILKEGSNEILSWRQSGTLESARAEAMRDMEAFSRTDDSTDSAVAGS